MQSLTSGDTGSSAKKKKNAKKDSNVCVQARIADRLIRAVDAANFSRNRSPELVPLTAEWESTKKKLRLLLSLTQDYANTTRKMHTSRSKLVNHLGMLSKKSPLFDNVGKPLNGKTSQILETIREDPATKSTVAKVRGKKSNDTSFRSIQALEQFATTQGVVNEREYHGEVIAYAIEWEKTATEQVESELKKIRKLQGDRSHYEKKVEILRQRANDLEEKGKTVPAAQTEKLERNETKFKEAFILHEKEAGRVCVLIEEVTTNGWKDLYHLVKNYCKWECNRVSRENEIYSEFSATLDSMKSTFKINAKKKK